jgi:hypothetical protein
VSSRFIGHGADSSRVSIVATPLSFVNTICEDTFGFIPVRNRSHAHGKFSNRTRCAERVSSSRDLSFAVEKGSQEETR